jgi:hypothetical protein
MHNNDYFNNAMQYVIQYLLVIGTFIFSVIAKLHNIIRMKNKMSKLECFVDIFLSGLGSAGIIYLLQFFDINIIVKCLLGGYSSLIVTPVSNVISKEITPILETITLGFKKWVTSYFNKKSDEK